MIVHPTWTNVSYWRGFYAALSAVELGRTESEPASTASAEPASFGAYVARARREQRLSVRKLWPLLGRSIGSDRLKAIESGEVIPLRRTAERFVNALNLPPRALELWKSEYDAMRQRKELVTAR